MSVSIVARRNDINANAVFGWPKQYREGKLELPILEAAPSAMIGTELLGVDVIDSALVLSAHILLSAAKWCEYRSVMSLDGYLTASQASIRVRLTYGQTTPITCPCRHDGGASPPCLSEMIWNPDDA